MAANDHLGVTPEKSVQMSSMAFEGVPASHRDASSPNGLAYEDGQTAASHDRGGGDDSRQYQPENQPAGTMREMRRAESTELSPRE